MVDQNKYICNFAIEYNPECLQYIREQTDELCMLAIDKDYKTLQYINYQTDKICLYAIKNNLEAFKLVKDKTENICLAVVQQDGLYLEYIEFDKQTRNICETAINNNSEARKFVKISLEPYYKESNATHECSICLDDDYNDTFYVLNNCKHTFHKRCFELLIDNKCPLCRQLMYEEKCSILQ